MYRWLLTPAVAVVALFATGFLAAVAASGTPTGNAHAGGDARLAPLHTFEEQRHRTADFRALPTGDTVTGPDPYVVRALPRAAGAIPGDDRLVSVLRGAGEVVLLDAQLH